MEGGPARGVGLAFLAGRNWASKAPPSVRLKGSPKGKEVLEACRFQGTQQWPRPAHLDLRLCPALGTA